MAKRRYYAGRKTYYNRRKFSRSTRAVSMSKAFKASAANMTQNGKFNISAKFNQTLNIKAGETAVFAELDVPNAIALSEMHRALSNVFDQYRIEKCRLKFGLLSNNELGTDAVYVAFFTACDRTGFAPYVDLASIRTYSSYKETVWSTKGDTNVPHIVNLGLADLASKCEYYDTKNRASFPKVIAGFDLGQIIPAAKAFTITCEVDAQIRYRGVRCDSTGDTNVVDEIIRIHGTEFQKLTNWTKIVTSTNVNVLQGYYLFAVRRSTLTIGNTVYPGWTLIVRTVPLSGSPTNFNLPASDDSPTIYTTYADTGTGDYDHLLFVDKEIKPLYSFLGASQSSSDFVNMWVPRETFDFTPLFTKYGNS